MLTPLILCFMGASAPAAAVSVESSAVVWQEPTATVDAYQELVAEYTKAVKAQKAAIRETKDLEKRRELRKSHPATAFKSRFDALVSAGDGRGLLWELDNQRYLGVPKAKRAEQRTKHYSRIVGEFSTAKWFPEALETIASDGKVDLHSRINTLKRVFADVKSTEGNKIAATFHVGALLMESTDENDNKMGKQMLKELIAKHPKSDFAIRALPIAEKVNVNVGAMAPDFVGTMPDGKTFRLSDYRGKIVMLDFFGFW